MWSAFHILPQPGPLSSGSQISGMRITILKRSLMRSGISTRHMLSFLQLLWMANNHVPWFVLLPDSPRSPSEQTCGIQSFLLRELSRDRSRFCSQPLFSTQNAIPTLHSYAFNWAEDILTLSFLPFSPYPRHKLYASLALIQAKDCFALLMLFCYSVVSLHSFFPPNNI